MKFRVFDRETNEEVTDEREWYLDTDCGLVYLNVDELDIVELIPIGKQYYYRLEIEE